MLTTRVVLAAKPSVPHAEELRRRGQRVLMILPRSLAGQVEGHRDDVFFVSGWSAYDELRQLALRLSDQPVASVTSRKDVCQTAAAFLRGLLGVPGMSWEQSIVATDKLLQKNVLRQAGLNVAACAPVRTLAGRARRRCCHRVAAGHQASFRREHGRHHVG